MKLRIGQGFDVHQWIEGRPLMLGGVEIPHTHGLKGHSDADVLLHAICDALLGALGKGDIGNHFPDNDPQYAGIDSRLLLRQVMDLVKNEGMMINNLDATVICQRPKLAPHIPAMRQTISQDLRCNEALVNIKATTTEKLGFTGRNEGCAAMAVVLLTSN